MFGQPKEVKPLVRPPMSGAEAMLKSMGLGEIIEAAKAFANAGTMQKIMAFADGVEGMNETLKSIDARLERLELAFEASEAYRDNPYIWRNPKPVELRPPDNADVEQFPRVGSGNARRGSSGNADSGEPCPGSDVGELGRVEAGTLEQLGPDRRLAVSSPSSGAADGDGRGFDQTFGDD